MKDTVYTPGPVEIWGGAYQVIDRTQSTDERGPYEKEDRKPLRKVGPFGQPTFS